MGKRERRRRRERLLSAPLTPGIARPPHAESSENRKPTSAIGADLASLVAQLRELDRAVDHEIDRLVACGASWPVIAAALGVSRQAARQRWLRRQPIRHPLGE